jgi:hypothetical protein
MTFKTSMEYGGLGEDPCAITNEELVAIINQMDDAARATLLSTPTWSVGLLVNEVLQLRRKHLVYEISIDEVPTFHQGDQPLPEICCDLVTAKMCNHTMEMLLAKDDVIRAQREAIEVLQKLVYVPGLWKCQKCDLRVLQASMEASSGALRLREEGDVPCPNGCGPMKRVTEREAGYDLRSHIEAMHAQIVGLVEALTAYKAGGKPQ